MVQYTWCSVYLLCLHRQCPSLEKSLLSFCFKHFLWLLSGFLLLPVFLLFVNLILSSCPRFPNILRLDFILDLTFSLIEVFMHSILSSMTETIAFFSYFLFIRLVSELPAKISKFLFSDSLHFRFLYWSYFHLQLLNFLSTICLCGHRFL